MEFEDKDFFVEFEGEGRQVQIQNLKEKADVNYSVSPPLENRITDSISPTLNKMNSFKTTTCTR